MRRRQLRHNPRWPRPAALVLFVWATLALATGAQALGPAALRDGFETNTLARNDDGSTGLVGIGFTLDFFGTNYSSLFVNNNGNVTFDSSLSTFTPFNLSTAGRIIIAPYFADVDTSEAGEPVRYGQGAVNGQPAFGVTWRNVDCYSSSTSRTVRNHFQVILIERNDTSPGNFDIEFNYDQIQWETGEASGGNFNCQGGSSARVGYSDGTAPNSFELTGSGIVGAFLDSNTSTGLIHNSLNSGHLGRYIFAVRAGSPIVANLSITKIDSPDPVLVNTNLTHSITVLNSGPDPATGVVITDPLPGNVQFVSASAGCIFASGTVTCSLGPLEVNGSRVRDVVVRPVSGSSVTNTASVTANEPDPVSGNNSATAVTQVILNQAPTCSNDSIVLSEDTIVSRDLRLNCSDPDPGDTIDIEIVSLSLVSVSPINVTGSLPFTLPLGSIDLKPALNFNGSGGSFTFRANDGAAVSAPATATVTVLPVNDPPVVAANVAAVTVDEGSTASNTGTYNDPDAGDNVSVTASVGAVTKTGANSGAWSWSLATTDGPAESQTVTIAVDDGNGGTSSTTFTLNVNNVAPTVEAGDNRTVNEGSVVNLRQNLIQNGSFESGQNPGPGFITLGAGSTAINNWTVGGFGIDYIGGLWVASNGGRSLDLSAGNAGSISQTFPTLPGVEYTVRFDLAGNTAPVCPPAVKPLDVSAAGNTVSFSFDTTGKSNSNMGWVEKSFTFTAVSNSTTLTFTSLHFSCAGPALDNVRVFAPATFTDPGTTDTHAATINWGDGTGNQPGTVVQGAGFGTVSGSHVYADDGSYTVTVTVTDNDGASGSDTLTVTVNNVAPTITSVSGAATIDEGGSVVISAAATDPGVNDTLLFSFDCDGNGTFEVTGSLGSGTCSYADNGIFPVNVLVSDGDGGTDTTTTAVTVNNVAPTIALSGAASVSEGSPYTLTLGAVTDPGADTVTQYIVHWGDGSPAETFPSAGNKTHVYADGPATRTISVDLVDEDSTHANAGSLTLTVTNVAPTITAAFQVAPIPEASVSVSGNIVAQATDPAGSNDPLTFTFDCNNDGAYETPANPNTSAADCFFDDNGSYTVGVQVDDGDGGVTTGSVTAIVTNVAPSLTLDISGAVGLHPENTFFLGVVGVPQNHSASATDPGSDDLTFDWNFGPSTTYLNDGVGVDPLPSPGGVFPFAATDTATATFSAPGVHEVTVVVTDDDGGSASASLTKLVVDGNQCARSKGFWRHQFSGQGRQHIDDATLEVYLSIVNRASLVFSEFIDAETLETAGLLFDPREQNDRDNDRRRKKLLKAVEQLLAAWLNFASGGVGWDEQLAIEGDDEDAQPPLVLSFHDAMAMAEAIILDPTSTERDLNVAKDLAEAVNESDEHNPACGDDDGEEDDDLDTVDVAAHDDDRGKGDDKDKDKDDKDNGGGRGRR